MDTKQDPMQLRNHPKILHKVTPTENYYLQSHSCRHLLQGNEKMVSHSLLSFRLYIYYERVFCSSFISAA